MDCISPGGDAVTRRASLFFLSSALIVSACQPQAAPSTLGRQLADPLAQRFYAARQGRAAWDAGRSQSLARALAWARNHALDRHAFLVPPSPGAQADEALTLTALAYAKALSGGLVEPSTVEPVFTLERNSADLAGGLATALERGDVEGWLASLPPVDAEYKALSAAYVATLAATPADTNALADTKALADSNAAADSNTAPANSTVSATASASTGPSQVRLLAANLERRRWLSRTPPAHRIDVNTALAALAYLNPAGQGSTARVVVGKPGHTTPSIQATFRRLVVNPPWKVPKDIAEKEILPKGAGYMARQDMREVDGGVEQKPGPKCALGQVKFDVADPYDIYLHDTPAKALFALPERHRSHGCVRVEHAVDFARSIAAETGKGDDFDKGLATKDTHEIDLGQTVAVRMLYHTAVVGPDGQVVLSPDAYGTDDALAAALGFGPASTPNTAIEKDDSELGP